MKNFYKLAVCLIASFMVGLPHVNGAVVQTFEEGGLNYKILMGTNVEVAKYTGENKYTGDIVIPATFVHDDVTYTVTSIGSQAFYACSGLTSMVIPNTVTQIRDHAFYQCTALANITMGTGIRTIEKYNFLGNAVGINVFISDLAKWVNINFADEWATPLRSKGNLWLNGELVENLVIPEGVEGINAYSFTYCNSIKSLKLPDSAKSVGNWAFAYCSNLEEIDFGRGLESLGFTSFGHLVKIKELNLPGSLQLIGHSAFVLCKALTKIVVPDGVLNINMEAFASCESAKEIIIGKAVKVIDAGAFSNCKAAEYVSLPASLTKIGANAFINSTAIKRVECLATVPPEAPVSAFSDAVYSAATLVVPDDCVEKYATSTWCWPNFRNISQFTSTPTVVADGVSVRVEGRDILVDGLNAGQSIAIYNISGSLIYEGTGSAIRNLPSGIYILRIGTRTWKLSL